MRESPKTYEGALKRWRRAENKAKLLRLENDSLKDVIGVLEAGLANQDVEIKSLKEDLDLVLGHTHDGPILIINL